jgi:hypothetical protein
MDQHTPGPWKVVSGAEHDISTSGEWDDEDAFTVSATKVLRGGDGEMAIVVIDMNFPNTWDDDLLDANAHLIAAAPDLLEACILARIALTSRSDGDEQRNAYIALNAAISRALPGGEGK